MKLLVTCIGAIAGISAVLWGALCLYSAPALASSDGLTLTAAAVGTVAGGELVVVQVTNTADVQVDGLKVATDAPVGVAVKPAAFTHLSLAAGASALFRFLLNGGPDHLPASLVITATGCKGAIPVSAMGTVALIANQAEIQVALSGDDTITDTSAATDVAIVQNLVDAPVSVILTASAGPEVVRLARIDGQSFTVAAPGPLTLHLRPQAAASVVMQTTAHLPLSRGSVPLVLTATTTDADGVTSEVTTVRDLQVSLAADVLPGPLGVGSVVLIPGLVAIWAIVAVYYRDRQRIGLPTPSAAAQVWDNKILLVAAILISVAAAGVYEVLGLGNVWSAPTLSDIVILSVGSAVAAGLVTDLVLFLWRRIGTAAVSPRSEPWDVLRTAARAEDSISRQVYRTSDGVRGLLVHKDLGTFVLTPPIQYADVDDIQGISSLTGAIALIRDTNNPREHVQFLADGHYVQGPGAVMTAIPLADQKEDLLRYSNNPLKGASATP